MSSEDIKAEEIILETKISRDGFLLCLLLARKGRGEKLFLNPINQTGRSYS
jgi:hypothetical protein